MKTEEQKQARFTISSLLNLKDHVSLGLHQEDLRQAQEYMTYLTDLAQHGELECHEKCCWDCDEREECESVCCEILSGAVDKPEACSHYEKRCTI